MAFKIRINILIFTILHTTLEVQSLTGPTHDKVVACYLARWAAYRPGAGKFDIHDIEPSLCTHIIYCFAKLDEDSNKLRSNDPWQDLEENYGRGGFKLIVGLKDKHPHLKVTLAIGGWNEGSAKYSKMAADPKLRKIFITSVVNFLEVHKLDGLDLFWDYPTKRGGKPEDRQNLVSLVKELTEAFEPTRWLLTATIKTGLDNLNTVYDLVQLNNYLDYMHLSTYDFHGMWDDEAGANAPIRSYDDEDIMSLEYTLNYLRPYGLNAKKLVLGLPMYGRTSLFAIPNPKEVQLGKTLMKNEGFPGPFTEEHGFMGYNEICLELMNKSSEWVYHWDDHTVTPYIRDDTRFISYDSPRSIANKVKLAMDNGFAGVSAWSITTDDFRGSCDEEPDTYIDFIKRYNRIAESPFFYYALYNLFEAGIQNEFYVISNGKAQLQLPKSKYGNYPLLKTANEAIMLSLEENRVIYEIERITNEVYATRADEPPVETKIKGVPCVMTCSEICFYG